MTNILIVDDEILIQKLFKRKFLKNGHVCKSAATMGEAMEMMAHDSFDIVFLDKNLPDGNGIDFIPALLTQDIPPLVIMITGSSDLDSVEKAIKEGAWDYMQKPISLSDLDKLVFRAVALSAEHQREKLPKNRADTIIGSSKSIIKAVNNLLQAAQSDVTVMLTGSSGTGKELFAHELHKQSGRSDQPFVVVDCTTLSETLIESLLFGYFKGAFTSAFADRVGLIQQADKGTLFLDEIGELSAESQKKFLRVIQERTIRPMGGRDYIPIDFRLVCATNRNLETMMKERTFRTDLFHRINVFPIDLPSIHDRQEDVIQLALFLSNQICRLRHLDIKKFDEGFRDAIQTYNWPGNVRELKNVLEKIILSTHDRILYTDHLPWNIRSFITQQKISMRHSNVALDDSWGGMISDKAVGFSGMKSMPPTKEVRENIIRRTESEYLGHLMRLNKWNIPEAIQMSGLAKSQLYRLLNKYDILPED